VFFGAWVTIVDEQGKEQEYRIVGADESDAARRYISVDSPLARALLGKAVDDDVVVDLPNGAAGYAVIAIRYQGQSVQLP
jgi:transcription elongation factor GreB